MRALKHILPAILFLALAVLPSCMKYGPAEEEDFNMGLREAGAISKDVFFGFVGL